MMSWLLVIILAYFFFSLSFLGDKLVLASAVKPKFYTFYVSIMGVLVVFAVPFIKFGFPNPVSIIWIIAESIVYLAGLYTMFLALEKLEASRVMTTIGATQPIFILFLTWFLWGFTAISVIEVFAFLLLLAGSICVSYEKKSIKTNGYIKIIILSAALFSLDYIFQKFIFLNQPFLQGLIWMRIAGFFLVLSFLFNRNFRRELFIKKNNIAHDKKMRVIFACSQACGGIGAILQSFAISLAPIVFLPIINALKGTQYAFLFMMTLFLSFFFPKILKENTNKSAVVKKIISIIIIIVGLAIITFY